MPEKSPRALHRCAWLLLALVLPVAAAPGLEEAIRNGKPIGGHAGATYADSEPGRLALARAPAGAPNVVVVLLDDVGFAAAGTFGGAIPTPAMDQLAKDGLRYTRFHTTAICSPTRAALLTGRNHHAVGMGMLADMPMGYEGYTTVIPRSAATVAAVLREHGYATAAFGKWHLSPPWERSLEGPFDHWPTRMGFDHYYGFLGGETDQYEPDLIQGTVAMARPDVDDYHLTEDLATRTIQWVQRQRAADPEKPFFVYLAPGATHAPLHVPPAWVEPFKGRFDQGWDAIRPQLLARQKQLGVVPRDTALSARPDAISAWDSLTPEQRRLAAELMELYAGFMAHTDAQIGRVVDALKADGAFDNTLFIYVVGDNGASAEAGPLGMTNVTLSYNGLGAEEPAEKTRLGGPESSPNYPAGWAWAMGTPFPWAKQVASHLGGTRNPLVVSWPAGIGKAGGVRSQFHHVIDIVPTIYDAAGVQPPAAFEGVAQQPIDGVSMRYSFDDAAAEGRRRTQYFEISGHRAIYHDGWLASAFHGRVPWDIRPQAELRSFADDSWELYDLATDFSQSKNLADAHPKKLAELKSLFWLEAGRNNVAPLEYRFSNRPYTLPSGNKGEQTALRFSGAVERVPLPRHDTLQTRSYTIDFTVTVPEQGARGVLAADGGATGGWALYLDDGGRLAYHYNFFNLQRLDLAAAQPLAAGRRQISAAFDYSGGRGSSAAVTVSVDGKQVLRGRVERTAPVFFSVSEPFDLGTDSLSPVGDYPRNHAFTGSLEQVVVQLR